MESRVLLTAVELGLFDQLAGGTRTSAQVAGALGTDGRATGMLLDALASMEIITRGEGGYRLREDAAPLLVTGAPRSLDDSLRHLNGLWERWSALTDVVRRGHPPAIERTEASRAALARAMRWHAREPAPRLAALFDRAGVTSMVDLGGGPGAFSIAMAQRFPALRAVLCDRDDQALALATEDIRAAGLQDRISTWRRDVLVDDIGTGYDLALLSSFLCTCGEPENRALLKRVRSALQPGGWVVVRDHLPDESDSPPATALFSVCMLVATTAGRVYSRAEVRRWLCEAGFTGVHWLPMDDLQVMIGRKRRD
jgi:predicted O-methyltransferase YrrM